MTLDEITYNLLNLIRGGRLSQDEQISASQIKFNIKHYRAMFIRRDYAQNGFVSRHIEQDLGCLDLIQVDASKCCGLPVTGCKVYRTVKKIPKTVRYNFKEALSYIGDVSGIGTIPFISSNTIQYLAYDKYTSGNYKAYMIEDYLYIYNADGLKYVNVRGVFEDPQEVAKFDCEGSSCYDDSASPFPIPLDMIDRINSGILNKELALLGGTFTDTVNDRTQDPKTIVPRQSNGGKK
jgi:hypothetical protein|tara:strand:+ start:54 stop:761 length:708 start_codon:yes stop_codon:yes gene_type:complete